VHVFDDIYSQDFFQLKIYSFTSSLLIRSLYNFVRVTREAPVQLNKWYINMLVHSAFDALLLPRGERVFRRILLFFPSSLFDSTLPSRVPLVIAETTHARLSSRDKVRRDRQVVPTTRAIAHFDDDFWRLERDIVSLEIRSVAVLFFPSPLLVPRVVEQVVVKVETFDRRRVVASRRQARRLYRRRAMHVLLDRAVLPNARRTSVVVVAITNVVISAPQFQHVNIDPFFPRRRRVRGQTPRLSPRELGSAFTFALDRRTHGHRR
jgi:hypothetical protein